jgi:hypothetical protein
MPSARAPRNLLATALSATALLATASLAACKGPALHVQNPERHEVFVDGRRLAPPDPRAEALARQRRGDEPAAPEGVDVVPYRYYGTTTLDVVPADQGGYADFAHRPQRAAVAIDEPVTPWLFPLDFPLELLRRVALGAEPTTAAVALPVVPPEQRIDLEIAPADATALGDRARAARIRR